MHPPHTTRANYLMKMYEQKTLNSSIKVAIDGEEKTIELSQNTVNMIKKTIKESAKVNILFDTHSIRLMDNKEENVCFEVSKGTHDYKVSSEAIKKYKEAAYHQPEMSTEYLLAIVLEAVANPNYIGFSIPAKDLENKTTFQEKKEFLKNKLQYQIPDDFDWDTLSISESKNPEMILVKLFERKSL